MLPILIKLVIFFYLNYFLKRSYDKYIFATLLAEENGPELPTTANEEFRPFIRRLPEFKFWYSVTKSTIIAIICTFFDCFNIPVFWPILVMYFITLFCITMKRQIRVSHKYEKHFLNYIFVFIKRLMNEF